MLQDICAKASGDSTLEQYQRRRWLRVRAAAAHLDLGVGTMNKLRI